MLYMELTCTCSVDKITRLSPEQVREFLDTDTRGEFQLVDVRQSYEYEEGHILLHELAGEERTHINVLLQQLEKPRGGAQQ